MDNYWPHMHTTNTKYDEVELKRIISMNITPAVIGK